MKEPNCAKTRLLAHCWKALMAVHHTITLAGGFGLGEGFGNELVIAKTFHICNWGRHFWFGAWKHQLVFSCVDLFKKLFLCLLPCSRSRESSTVFTSWLISGFIMLEKYINICLRVEVPLMFFFLCHRFNASIISRPIWLKSESLAQPSHCHQHFMCI